MCMKKASLVMLWMQFPGCSSRLLHHHCLSTALALSDKSPPLPWACNWLTAGKPRGFVFLYVAVRSGCWNVTLLFNFSTKPQLELPCSTDSLVALALPSASTHFLLQYRVSAGKRFNNPKAATSEGKGSQRKMLKHTSTPSPPSRSIKHSRTVSFTQAHVKPSRGEVNHQTEWSRPSPPCDTCNAHCHAGAIGPVRLERGGNIEGQNVLNVAVGSV